MAALCTVAASTAQAQTDGMSGSAFSLERYSYPDRVGLSPPETPSHVIRYGVRSWQRITLYDSVRSGFAPLIILMSGSSWNARRGAYPTVWLVHRLTAAGYTIASIGLDGSTPSVEGDPATLAAGIALLRSRASDLRIDPDRIVLIGIDAGAHYATLLGTDETYLAAASVPFAAVRGVVSINGGGFDIPRRLAGENRAIRLALTRAFGKDPERQTALSPAAHTALPNAPAFLFMAAENEPEATAEATALTTLLSEAGTATRTIALPRFREGSLATYFLAETRGAGRELLPFLDEVTK